MSRNLIKLFDQREVKRYILATTVIFVLSLAGSYFCSKTLFGGLLAGFLCNGPVFLLQIIVRNSGPEFAVGRQYGLIGVSFFLSLMCLVFFLSQGWGSGFIFGFFIAYFGLISIVVYASYPYD